MPRTPDQLTAFMNALEARESGGRNHRPNSSGASGYYQMIPGTWGGYGGYSQAYQAPRSVQRARAAQLISGYYSKYKDWWLVAVAWHAGPGNADKAARNRSYAYSIGDVNIKTGQHADNIISTMQSGYSGGQIGTGPGLMSTPGSPDQTFMNDFGYTRPMNAQEAKARAKELYGYLGWYVDHPEVGPVLIRGAMEGWGPERLQGALTKTKWWQTHSESQRQFGALLVSDIATAKRRINEAGFSIKTMAAKLGVPLPRARLFGLAVHSVSNQWNEQEIQLALASELRWNPKMSERGEVGNMMQGIRALAADYMVPLTRRQEFKWVKSIVAGATSPEAVKATLQKNSISRFPHLADEINRGVTPRQFFEPYKNIIAQELEINPEQVDPNSPDWRGVLSYRDPKSSKVRPMTLTEATQLARKDKRWGGTQGAKALGGQVTQMFQGLFGT